MARCQAMRGGVTNSEASIIADLQAAERSRDELARAVRDLADEMDGPHPLKTIKRKLMARHLRDLLSRLNGGGK